MNYKLIDVTKMVSNMSVKKIMTFKSGKFVFSNKISEIKLNPLIIELQILYQTVKDLPILPSLSTQIEAELIRRSIFSTAAIEGNPLEEETVAGIIAESDKKKFRESCEIEITNLKDTYDFIKDLPISGSRSLLDEKFIKNIHRLITKNVKHEYNNPGIYRNHIVKVGDKQHGGIYTPPKCLADIQTLMQEYINWINSDNIMSLKPSIRAALAHYYFGMIHPFGDGNGRTARIIEAALLKLSGIKYIPTMLSNFYYRNMDEYFLAFSISRKNKEYDVTPFIEFVLRGCVESLKEIKQRITFYIRKLTLKDHYTFLKVNKKITHRQHELLLALLEEHEQYSFVLNDLFSIPLFRILYTSVSERTARRDLHKLRDMRLLSVIDNRHILNWRSLNAI